MDIVMLSAKLFPFLFEMHPQVWDDVQALVMPIIDYTICQCTSVEATRGNSEWLNKGCSYNASTIRPTPVTH